MMKYVALALFACCALAHAELVKLEAAELPCAFSFTMDTVLNCTVVNETESVPVSVERTVSHVDYYGFMVLNTSVRLNETDSSQISVLDQSSSLVRTDLNSTENGVVRAPFFYHNSTHCVNEMIDLKDARDNAFEVRNLVHVVDYFEGANDTTFNGTACKVYYNETNSSTYYYYVDSELRVIGILFRGALGNMIMETVTVVNYRDQPTLSTFVMDKNAYSGCNESAYTAPTVDLPCSLIYTEPSSSSSESSEPSGTGSSSSSSSKTTSSSVNPTSTSSAATNVAYLALVALILAILIL